MTATCTAPVTYTEVLTPTASCRHRAIKWTPDHPGLMECRGRLVIETSRCRRCYYAFPFDADDGRGVRLVREDGEAAYSVFLADDGVGHSCDCAAACYEVSETANRRAAEAGRPTHETRGCRHLDAFVAMQSNGWI